MRWPLRTEIPTASAATCWLRPLARLAMYRSLIRNDRGAGIAGAPDLDRSTVVAS